MVPQSSPLGSVPCLLYTANLSTTTATFADDSNYSSTLKPHDCILVTLKQFVCYTIAQ